MSQERTDMEGENQELPSSDSEQSDATGGKGDADEKRQTIEHEVLLPDTGYDYYLGGVDDSRYEHDPILLSHPNAEAYEGLENVSKEQTEAFRKLMFLKQELDREIPTFTKKRASNRKRATLLKVLSVVSAAVVTVLLGVSVSEHYTKILNQVALVISAFTTVLASFEHFFDNKDLWVRYTKTVDKLEILKSSIEYLESGGYYSVQEVEKLKLKYDQIKQNTSEFVVSVRDNEGGEG